MIRSLFRSFARKIVKQPSFPPGADKSELSKALNSFIGEKLQEGKSPEDVLKYMFGKDAINRVHEAMNTKKPMNFADVDIKISDELMQRIKPFMPSDNDIANLKNLIEKKEAEEKEQEKNEPEATKKIDKEEVKTEGIKKENDTNKKQENIGRRVEKSKNKRKGKINAGEEKKKEEEPKEGKNANKNTAFVGDIEKRLEQLRNKRNKS